MFTNLENAKRSLKSVIWLVLSDFVWVYVFIFKSPINKIFSELFIALLDLFRPGILWKIGIKKKQNAALNRCISKARVNSESKLTFSESSFNFLQNRVIFCTLYPRGYTAWGSTPYNHRCRCQQLVGLKELQWKKKTFLSISFKKNFQRDRCDILVIHFNLLFCLFSI